MNGVQFGAPVRIVVDPVGIFLDTAFGDSAALSDFEGLDVGGRFELRG